MRRFYNDFLAAAVFALVFAGLSADASAQRRTEREVRDAVRTLNSDIDDLRYALEFEVRNNGGGRALSDAVRGLESLRDKVDAFDDNVTMRRDNRDDINEIVTAARDVDAALRGSAAVNRTVAGSWSNVKRTIDSLAMKYGVTPDWSARISNGSRGNSVPQPVQQQVSGGLTGTYDLDAARSEKIADILTGTAAGGAQKQDLESKLEAPEQIAILHRGNQVTLASSKAAPITIVADGRDKIDTAGGKTIRTRATLRGQDLVVSSLGGETDYTITFSPIDNGRGLKVTRRITTDYLSETIFAESIYTKSDGMARLGIDNTIGPAADDAGYSSNDPQDNVFGNAPSVVTPRIGEFIVPNGMVLAAVLENQIDTKISQNNDRFRLTVQSPDEFRGAIIEGYISGVGRSGQVSGRSNVTFNFTRITLRDGKAYDFAGSVSTIKDAYGKDIKIDAEGTAKGDSQTRETAKRGGIGAGIGAVIGAIAGGGKGAAIGAIIGGGAGAGSVIAQGRDDLKIQQGSVMTVTSSSPIRNDSRVSENK
jgi:hypothetical protein